MVRLITKPGLLEHKPLEEHKSQEEEIKESREWSRVFERHLEAYMQDLKKIHDKPNDSFDMDLAEKAEKTRCIKLYGLLASLMRGRHYSWLKLWRTPMDLMPGGV